MSPKVGGLRALGGQWVSEGRGSSRVEMGRASVLGFGWPAGGREVPRPVGQWEDVERFPALACPSERGGGGQRLLARGHSCLFRP